MIKKFLENIGKTEIRNTIAVLYLLLVLAYIYVLAFKPVPTINKDLINVLGGTVIGGSGLILAYYFGASKGDNENKTEK